LQKTLPPFADGGFGPMKPGRDLRVALALGGPQYHLGAGDQAHDAGRRDQESCSNTD